MTISKHFLIRFLIAAIPLTALYFFSEAAFEANRQKENPADAGLGIAFLLVFILIILFIGFAIDFIKRLYRKEYKIAAVNIPFLIPFIVFLLYMGCLIASRNCFCSWIIKTVKLFTDVFKR